VVERKRERERERERKSEKEGDILFPLMKNVNSNSPKSTIK